MTRSVEKAMDSFIVQLNGLKNLYTSYQKKTDFYEKDFGTKIKLLIDRKIYDYEKMQGLDSDLSEEIPELISGTNELLKKEIWKKIYNVIEVNQDDEDEELTISFTDDFLLKAFRMMNEEEEDIYSDESELIMQSVLMNLCIALESMSSEVLINYYYYCGGTELSNKTLTYDELIEIEDIEDAKRYLVERNVESIFYNSFNKWFEKMDERLHIKKEFSDVLEVNELIAEINEAFLRRNILVHNNGKVNKKYLTNVCDHYKELYSVNDLVKLDKEYLDKKIDCFEKLGWMIFFKSMEINQKSTGLEDIIWAVNNKALNCIKSNCDLIPSIFRICSKKSPNQQQKYYCAINYYLFYKINNRLEEVIEELTEFDVSILSDEFVMAKAILLDSEDCFEIIKKHFSTLDDLDFLNKIRWPLIGVIIDKEPYDSYFIKQWKERISTNERLVGKSYKEVNDESKEENKQENN